VYRSLPDNGDDLECYQRRGGVPSASQFPDESQELEIHSVKNFKGSHKKESVVR
jgi:hypothetical protein